MYPYTLSQWLFLFYFYCFLGWCVESTHVSIRQKPPHWVNRGFIRGPFLPLYGSGAIMMLVVSAPFQHDLFLTYVAGCIGATVLEYITGVTMEALFKVRYWDYSEQPFNFQGHICLGTTLAWGGLTILMTRIIHKPIEGLLYMVPENLLSILTFVLTVFIAADFALSFRAALDIRDILIAMEKVKEEMAHMQKRLDVILAVTGEEIGQYRSAAEVRVEELTESIEGKLYGIKERIQIHPGEYLESAKNEALEIRDRFMNIRYRVSELKTIKDHWKRSMILGNPGMKGSAKVRFSLEELKEAVKEKLNRTY
ncbi:MAG: hypothetical protein HDQ96_12715 [Lachnospiraceae bacterium]|nr:hypothetical protein [Lachnospiraceae bacterium]